MSYDSDKLEWVVLFTSDGRNRTKGPVSRNEVLKKIALGEISYSDKIWRSPEKTWSRIGDREEFNRRPERGRSYDAKPDSSPETEFPVKPEILLSNVLRYDKASAPKSLLPVHDDIPEDAIGEDLARVGTKN